MTTMTTIMTMNIKEIIIIIILIINYKYDTHKTIIKKKKTQDGFVIFKGKKLSLKNITEKMVSRWKSSSINMRKT